MTLDPSVLRGLSHFASIAETESQHLDPDSQAALAWLAEHAGWKPSEIARHCDDYIDDLTAPACLREFLAFARQPAHGMLTGQPKPKLFADFNSKRVRVVMASRIGDVGITSKLDAEFVSELRVPVEQLANFGVDP